jgi:hypothetical protein
MATVPEEGKLLGDALATVKMQVQQMKRNLVLLLLLLGLLCCPVDAS